MSINKTLTLIVLVLAIALWGELSFIGQFDDVESALDRLSESLDTLEHRLRVVEERTESLVLLTGSLDENLAEGAAEREKLAEAQVATEESFETELLERASQDTSAIVEEWKPFVYKMVCRMQGSDGDDVQENKASATLETYPGGEERFVLNSHTLLEGGVLVDECRFFVPGVEGEIVIDDSDLEVDPDRDIGYGFVPDSDVRDMPVLSRERRCEEIPTIGDKVVILGYPKIGGDESITATEGIISGFDKDFYTTSAKIDSGHSGGMAIHVKNNCFLGLPTLVVRGKLESLARILPL